jgi:phage tail sheath protein FI
MPAALTYPGVYVEEIPSGVRTIVGVATSITAFLGRAAMGPDNEPVMINSFADFERWFGGLGATYPMSYAVRDFYLNGGTQALIVRLFNPNDAATGYATVEVGGLKFKAASRGTWGRNLRVSIGKIEDSVAKEVRITLGLKPDDVVFNLTATTGPDGVTEQLQSLSVAASPRQVDKVVNAESRLIRWNGGDPTKATVNFDSDAASKADNAVEDATTALRAANNPAAPDKTKIDAATADLNTKQQALDAAKKENPPNQAKIDAAQKDVDTAQRKLDLANQGLDASAIDKAQLDLTNASTALGKLGDGSGASDGNSLVGADYNGDKDKKTGMYALEKADLFNLLCIPADQRGGDTPQDVYQTAMQYCVTRRALLLVDPPASWGNAGDMAASTAASGLPGLGLSGTQARNAALYFPRLIELDPFNQSRPDVFVPCGAVAGIMASTDVQRGVWKAPAGLDAAINGIAGLQVNLSNAENGMLNPLGINCLRFFQINGRVVWGARTLRGADQLADEYKYVPVRRLALFMEESLYRGTQWVVFEPNDEPLWAQIRLNVGAFMHNLFRQGAFQGTTPRDAYYVKCDKETTTQNDIDLGIVNIVVGFAPLKPAEFVVIKLQQMAGQIET